MITLFSVHFSLAEKTFQDYQTTTNMKVMIIFIEWRKILEIIEININPSISLKNKSYVLYFLNILYILYV